MTERQTLVSCVCLSTVIKIYNDIRNELVMKVLVDFSVIPWTAACQAPLFIEFSRSEYWSGLPFPFPGDLPNPGLLQCRQRI